MAGSRELSMGGWRASCWLCLLLTFVAHLLANCQVQPLRTVRPDMIILDNGATTYVSTLEDYLARSEKVLAKAATSQASLQLEVASIGPSELERESININVNNNSNSNNNTYQEGHEHKDTSVKTAQLNAAELPSLEHNTAPINPTSSIPQASPAPSRAHLASGSAVNGTSGKGNAAAKPILQHYEVKSLLNVTHDYPLASSQIICGYIWPLMALITLFTNLMIVFILTQPDMRTPTNVVLTAIAIADIIPIVVPVPWFVYLFALGNEKQVLYPPLTCYFYQHSTRSISEIFYFLSTWLNVLLAIQDYLTASWPKLAKKYCQIKVVVIEIISLTLLAFLLNLPQALKLVFKPVKFYYNGQITWGCRALQAKWFKDLVGEYVALYDDIFTAVIVIFVDGGPSVVLITLTALLIRQLQKQRIQGHLLMEQARTASKRRRERHRQQENEASARVMIFVLLAFLAVKIPFATTYTLMIVQSRFEIHFVDNLVDFQRAITLIDLVFVLSYPINFTIFCCCSKKFRHKCAQLMGERRSAKSSLMRSTSGSLTSSVGGDTLTGSLIRKTSALGQTGNLKLEDNQQRQRQYSVASVRSLILSQNNEKQTNGSRSTQVDHLENGDLRRLLEDGSLCLECVWHYEQIRRNARKDVPIAWHCPQTNQRRPPKADSTPSWPSSLPLGVQLPSIVTTRCESINEQSNSIKSSELDAASMTAELIATSSADQSGFSSADEESGIRGHFDLSGQGSTKTVTDGYAANTRATTDASDGNKLDTKLKNWPHLELEGSTSSFKVGGSIDGRHSESRKADRPLGQGQRSGSGSSARMSSYPGSGFLGTKQLESLIRRLSNHVDQRRITDSDPGDKVRRARRKLGVSQLLKGDRRSLSLSNSKLSTLSNATGLLADVLMSSVLDSEASETRARGDDS